MTVSEFLKQIEYYQTKIRANGSAHSYPATVNFILDDEKLDIDLELSEINPVPHLNCGCWTGIDIILKVQK